MRLNIGKTRLIQLVVTTIAVISGIVILLIWRNGNDGKLLKNLTEYSHDFSQRYYQAFPNDTVRPLDRLETYPDSIAYRRMLDFGRHLFKENRQRLAFEYMRNCLKILETHSEISQAAYNFKAGCCLRLGAASDEVGIRSISHEYYFNGLKAVDNMQQKGLRCDLYNNLGVSCLRSGKYDESAKYFNMALEQAEKYNKKDVLYIANRNLSVLYAETDDFDKARDYALKSIQYVDEKADPVSYYSNQTVIGDLYCRKGDRKMGYSYLSNSFSNLSRLGEEDELFTACLCLMDYFKNDPDKGKAEAYRAIASRIADKSNNPDFEIQLLEKESEAASDEGNVVLALAQAKRIMALKDSIYKSETALWLEQAENIYEIERNNMRQSLSISGWNPVVVLVIMGLMVLILVVIVVYLIRIKHNREELIEQKDEAVLKFRQLNEQRIREEAEKRDKIQQDLDIHNRKLTSFTLERLESNEKVEYVSTGIKQLILKTSPRDKASISVLKDILTRLNGLKYNSQWSEFQYYFEQVHPQFYPNLDKMHPGLTAKDRRLCAFISLGMSTKEIASITCREVRSVESSRNRLRKKINISPDTSLSEYLISLTVRSSDDAND